MRKKIVLDTNEADMLCQQLKEKIEEARDHGVQTVFFYSFEEPKLLLEIVVKPTKQEYKMLIKEPWGKRT